MHNAVLIGEAGPKAWPVMNGWAARMESMTQYCNVAGCLVDLVKVASLRCQALRRSYELDILTVDLLYCQAHQSASTAKQEKHQ